MDVMNLPSLKMHYRQWGDGEHTAVLLHGWPQTSQCWEDLAPLLAGEFRLIAPDLRGYGLSDKPAEGYDKRRMAADVIELLDALGVKRPHLVGHDRGGRVAHRFALDHPDRLASLTVLDIAPTHAMFAAGMRTAEGFFHWLLHMQPDLPELLTAGREEQYLRYFFSRWTLRRDRLEPRIPDYVRAFEAPGAMRAGFDDYRASREDIELDEQDQRAGRLVQVPTLALWGGQGLAGGLSVLDMWRPYVAGSTSGEDLLSGRPVPECGHFIPEEQPEELAAELLRFWSQLG